MTRQKTDSILPLVRERCLADSPEAVQGFIQTIRDSYGDENLLGIFMYGSMLSQVTASSTSFPDFFVITDGYKEIFKRWSHWLTAQVVPPHIFHLRLDDERHCKYNLLSMHQFEKETSRDASDIYILGRFGKRVALVWWRDAECRDRLIRCCASAMDAVAGMTLKGMPDEFSLLDFIMACLNISYEGETRVEAGSKVGKLFASEEAFYRRTYPRLLRALLQEGRVAVEGPEDHFKRIDPEPKRRKARRQLQDFLKKSRVRGVLRWPKFLLTVDEWVDIILAKLERTKGIRLEPTPMQRKYPLIFGWPHFFRLLKGGVIRPARRQDSKSTSD